LWLNERLLRGVELEQYEVFHAQGRSTANVLGRLNQLYQKPLFFTPHCFMTQRRLQFNLIERESIEYAYSLAIDQQAVRFSSHMIILCDAFRPIMDRLGAQDDKMTTVYTGIEFDCKNAQESTITKPDNKKIISCIS